MTILVVDDSPVMVMSLARVLKKAGFTVETAGDGTEGLAKINAGLKPALILTDLNMPQMDGISLIKAVRKLPQGRFTPIIVLTTEANQATSAEARAAGATGWLTKPTEPEELLKIIRHYATSA